MTYLRDDTRPLHHICVDDVSTYDDFTFRYHKLVTLTNLFANPEAPTQSKCDLLRDCLGTLFRNKQILSSAKIGVKGDNNTIVLEYVDSEANNIKLVGDAVIGEFVKKRRDETKFVLDILSYDGAGVRPKTLTIDTKDMGHIRAMKYIEKVMENYAKPPQSDNEPPEDIETDNVVSFADLTFEDFAEGRLFSITHPVDGIREFYPNFFQKEILHAANTGKNVWILGEKQDGKTTAAAVYLLWKALKVPGIRIVVGAPAKEGTCAVLEQIRSVHKSVEGVELPKIETWDAAHIRFANDSFIAIVNLNTSPGKTFASFEVGILYLDDFDYAEPKNAETFLQINWDLLQTGGRQTIIASARADDVRDADDSYFMKLRNWEEFDPKIVDYRNNLGIQGAKNGFEEHGIVFIREWLAERGIDETDMNRADVYEFLQTYNLIFECNDRKKLVVREFGGDRDGCETLNDAEFLAECIRRVLSKERMG